MALETDLLLQQVKIYAKSAYLHHDPAHNILHIQCVLSTALRICDCEQRSGTRLAVPVVQIACWLHDIVQLPKGTGIPGTAARQSATLALTTASSIPRAPGYGTMFLTGRIINKYSTHWFQGLELLHDVARRRAGCHRLHANRRRIGPPHHRPPLVG